MCQYLSTTQQYIPRSHIEKKETFQNVLLRILLNSTHLRAIAVERRKQRVMILIIAHARLERSRNFTTRESPQVLQDSIRFCSALCNADLRLFGDEVLCGIKKVGEFVRKWISECYSYVFVTIVCNIYCYNFTFLFSLRFLIIVRNN